MKQTLLITILALLLVIPCTAQRNPLKSAVTPKAQKFSEILWTDYTALHMRMQDFVKALRRKPNAKAYVIVYERHSTNEYMLKADTVLNYAKTMLEEAKISSQRIIGIEGGTREKIMIELFIVPKGAVSPAPTKTIDAK